MMLNITEPHVGCQDLVLLIQVNDLHQPVNVDYLFDDNLYYYYYYHYYHYLDFHLNLSWILTGHQKRAEWRQFHFVQVAQMAAKYIRYDYKETYLNVCYKYDHVMEPGSCEIGHLSVFAHGGYRWLSCNNFVILQQVCYPATIWLICNNGKHTFLICIHHQHHQPEIKEN